MLEPGRRLGPYEILAPLGAGGMGEIYRARDSRLDRDVAVKVLAQHLSASAEIRARADPRFDALVARVESRAADPIAVTRDG